MLATRMPTISGASRGPAPSLAAGLALPSGGRVPRLWLCGHAIPLVLFSRGGVCRRGPTWKRRRHSGPQRGRDAAGSRSELRRRAFNPGPGARAGPGLYLSECFRVLRPGGQLLLSTHGVFPYHPDPVDLWRWTCEGLRIRSAKPVSTSCTLRAYRDGRHGIAAPSGCDLIPHPRSPGSPGWRCWSSRLVAFLDRFETPGSRSYNAQVFALVANRPA